MITLYHMRRSRSVRVRWLLEAIGLDYVVCTVNIRERADLRPSYLAGHPLGQVPAIEIDGQLQFESGAICHSLTDRHALPALAPIHDTPERWAYEQWFFYAVTTLEQPAFQYLQHAFLLPKTDRLIGVLAVAEKAYFRALQPLEAHLSQRDYLLGNTLSTADIMVGSVLMWLPKKLADYPALNAYVSRLKGGEAYQRATVS